MKPVFFLTLTIGLAGLSSSRAAQVINESFGQAVVLGADARPISAAPGWRAVGKLGGNLTDYTHLSGNVDVPNLSTSSNGGPSGSPAGYLVMGVNTQVTQVLAWKETARLLQGYQLDSLSFSTRNNSASSNLRIAVRLAGGSWYVSNTTLTDNGNGNTWTGQNFTFPAATWSQFNATTLTPGAAVGTLPAGNVSGIGLFGNLVSGKMRVDEFKLQATPTAPVAQPDTVTVPAGQKVRLSVLANDTGSCDPATLALGTPPQAGTALPDATGQVLYTPNPGAWTGDTFTYHVNGPAGSSAPATVTLQPAAGLRLSNSSLNVPADPPATFYQLTPAFGNLVLDQPVAMSSPPGDTQRLFICEKTGLLRVIPNVTADPPTAATFLNLPSLLTSRGETISTSSEQGLIGLAFHPDYAANRFFFVFYSVTKGGSTYERVSRFTTRAANPNEADPASEKILIEQVDRDSNHNGGDLQFGPDGYLYISFGDEGAQNDSRNNSQRINLNFFSALARIDVDEPARATSIAPNPHAAIPTDLAGGVPVARFKVPRDNPYVHTTLGGSWNGQFNNAAIADLTKVRTEFWAVGFRNPWRFSFDKPTGELWLGDVGQDKFEEVNLISRGGNFGWAMRDAGENGPRSGAAPANFDTVHHTKPLYAYVHTGVSGGDANFKGNSITGGIVYRGSRFAALQGAYLFSDYVSGHVWSLRRNGTNPPTVTRIAGEGGISAFGTDPSNGDVLLADHDNNRILRLSTGTAGDEFPATLSETGLFADLTDLSPSPGVLPYAPNLSFWSDHAVKRRWFSIPVETGKITWSRDGLWTFPAGMLWVKHFDLETTRGDPTTRKRLETRLLVKNAAGSYGVSYRWNEAQTEAVLAPDEGVDFPVNLLENGTPSVQTWRIPGRAECLVCHTPQAGHALSFNTRQLNLTNTINGLSGNQLTLLHDAGYFLTSPESPNVLPRHVRPEETAFPLEARVRSWLAVNCAYCHKAGGSAPAAWDGRIEITLNQTGLINGAANNNGGDPLNKLIVPGDLLHSVVLNRTAATNGFTRMPPLATTEADPAGIALLTDWISNSLPGRITYDAWRLAEFNSSTSPESAPAFDADGDGRSNADEFLAGTAPRDGSSMLHPSLTVGGGTATLTFPILENRSFRIDVSTDLADWRLWDAPGNHGLPQPAGTVNLPAPATAPRQFWRVRLLEN